MPNKSGFSLVELLVIVSLITTLSVVGLVMFQSARGKAQEAKYRGDVAAIKKAYEKNYDPTANGGQGGYKLIQDGDFVSNKKPKDKDNNDYIITPPANTDGSVSSYVACINPQTGESCTAPNAQTCTCAVSTQGGGSQVSNIYSSTCDPYGILGNGLVGYWKFDETSGTIAADTINNSNGTLVGSTFVTTPGSCKLGNCVTTNSINNNITTTASTVFNTQTAFTYSVWVKLSSTFSPNPANRWPMIIATVAGNSYTHKGYGLRYILPANVSSNSNSAYIYFEWGKNPPCADQSGGYASLGIVTAPLDDTWRLITVTYDGTTLSSYVNGNPGSSTATNVSPLCNIGSTGMYLGQRDSSAGTPDMVLDDARVYNHALSASEVGALYNGGMGCVPN